MGILIVTEDARNDGYRVIASRHLGDQPRLSIRLQQIRPDDIVSETGWRWLIEAASSSRSECVIVVIDQEGYQAPDRPLKIKQMQLAYKKACAWLKKQQGRGKIGEFKISLVISQTCLEGWLLADVMAVVKFASAGHGCDFVPHQPGRPFEIDPPQASRQLDHIISEIDRKNGCSTRRHYEKSESDRICQHLDLALASARNPSLGYFLERVECTSSGCDQPQIFPAPN